MDEKYSALRSLIIKKSLRPEVLNHLDTKKIIYEKVPKENYILVDHMLVNFFRKYREILLAALNYTITRYLEKLNFVPRIAEKISGNIPRSYPTEEERQIILKINNLCFYCKKNPGICMDHVIPFNFLFQTEIFNIVPACKGCNSTKK